MPHIFPDHPRVGVGILVWRGEELLLVQRGKPPGMGEWSLPGGSQELGETLFETAIREVREETGLTVRPTGIVTAVDSITHDESGRVLYHYTIIDVAAEYVAGQPVAGDDALDVRWATVAQWRSLVAWPPLLAVLEQAWAARAAASPAPAALIHPRPPHSPSPNASS